VNALVLLHQGLDPSLALEPADGGTARPRRGDPLAAASDADRSALECALGLARQVTVLSVGPPAWEALLDRALARGAHRGVRLWDDALAGLDAAALGRVLALAVGRLEPDLVLAGERGLEGGTGVVPALVAARLGWPCLDAAVRVAFEDGLVVVQRRLPGGRREEVAAEWPVVVSVARDAAEPRYVSVRARRAAERRTVECWDLASLGLDPATVRRWIRLQVTALDWPRPRPRRTPAASRSVSAADRLRQLMGPGPGAPKPGSPARVLEGDPGGVADRLLAFLEARGLLRP